MSEPVTLSAAEVRALAFVLSMTEDETDRIFRHQIEMLRSGELDRMSDEQRNCPEVIKRLRDRLNPCHPPENPGAPVNACAMEIFRQIGFAWDDMGRVEAIIRGHFQT